MGRNADTHIRVTEDTWQELNQKKGPGDSFDDVITQLLDADAAETAISEFSEEPEVGDEIDHPTIGRARVVAVDDGQISVEAIDEENDDDDTETITADELDPKNLVDDMSRGL